MNRFVHLSSKPGDCWIADAKTLCRAQNQLAERMEALPEVTEAWPEETSNAEKGSAESAQVCSCFTDPSPNSNPPPWLAWARREWWPVFAEWWPVFAERWPVVAAG